MDDIFIFKKDIDNLKNVLKEMGPGAIIFTTSQEEALILEKEIPNSKFINSSNIKKIDELVDIYEEEIIENEEENDEDTNEIEEIEKIKEGIDYLIGIASPYSILVRGLDLPYKIRYTVFWGVPKRKIDLLNLEKYRNTFFVQKFLSNLFFKRKMVSLQKIKEYINEIDQPKVISAFVIKENLLYSVDVKTYLQASGRCSRITPYGITKGVSFIFDDEIFFEPLSKLARFNNFDIKSFEEVCLRKLREEIDQSRRKDADPREFDFKTYLMVVESPTKARQIAQMFGNPGVIKIGNSQAFEVVSPIGVLLIVPSLGHIVELCVDETNQKSNVYNVIVDFSDKDVKNVTTLYCSIKKCKDCKKTFVSTSSKCIYCSSVNITSSLENVSSLKTLSFFSDGLIVSTDPDSEGEKISYDIVNFLNCENYKRVIFNEVTKKAIVNALNNPINIRQNLVNAQLVRRIEDRWIGFSLSKIMKEKMEEYNISAGRVQSPVLHWISQRYKEYTNKKRFSVVEIEDFKIQFVDSEIKGEAELEIQITQEYQQKINIIPFNTSDIIIFANNVLKINSFETMKILQQLFENGLITYHRTESYYISDYGISLAREIFDKKGWEFNYKNFGEPSTHEAIRITKFLEPEDVKILYQDKLNSQAFRLYEMIYRRFLACFTKDNYVKVAKYKFSLRQGDKYAQTEQERVIEIFGKAFEIFPYLAYKSKVLQLGKYKVKVKNIKKPTTTLYSQADIVKMMREKEIGRPSTYAYIIQKLFSR
ncbi:MAG: reverse gyrase, partial [bacterium]